MCGGYGFKLVWVTNSNTYKSHERRFLPCELTWADVPALASDEVDYFISLCEVVEITGNTCLEWAADAHIPFGVFHSKIPTSLICGTPLKDHEAFLFKHYVDHVAALMMPYEDARNPWKSSYPAVALHSVSRVQIGLYRAMLAQAAVNLAHLGCNREMSLLLGAKYYSSAIAALRDSIDSRDGDYASLLAAIMTLMFVEV